MSQKPPINDQIAAGGAATMRERVTSSAEAAPACATMPSETAKTRCLSDGLRLPVVRARVCMVGLVRFTIST